MKIDIKGIVIICGNYGSGKTETAINLAAARKKDGIEVKIADLDLVNPYFRAREARIPLEALGVEVILPDKKYMHADLPILTPAVAGILKQPAELTLLDAGGDDAGVTVLAALEDYLVRKKIKLLQVINPFRPFTSDVKGCLKIKEEIESASKIKVTGFVSNANLIDETTLDHIYKGYDLVRDVSEATGLKVEFITVASHILPELEMDRFACPVLEINRKLNPPWKHS